MSPLKIHSKTRVIRIMHIIRVKFMAGQNKIEQYNLENRVLELKGEGCPQDDIAKIVTRELKEERGIDDGISQSTVQRFLAKKKAERSEQASAIVQDWTKITVPNDLKIIEEIQEFLINIKRNLKKDEKTGEMVDAGIELRNRVYAAVSLARVTFDKLKNLGALKPPEEGTGAKDGEPDIDKSPVSSGSKVRSITDRFGISNRQGAAGSST